MNQGQREILSKYPPVNDPTILERLQQKLKMQSQEIEQNINSFFNDFTRDILDIIDSYRQSLICQVQDITPRSGQMLKKYQEISKINEMRQLLLNENMNLGEKESQIRDIIILLQEERSSNTQQLKNLLNQNECSQMHIDFKYLTQVKLSITNLLDYFFAAKEFQIDELDKLIDSKDDQVNTFIKSISQHQSDYSKHQLIYLKHIMKQINPILESISQNVILKNTKMKPPSDPIDILQNINFTQTKYQNNCNKIQITKKINNEINITTENSSEYWVPCVSNIILERQKKYVFRFKIMCFQKNVQFAIGLVRDIYKNHNPFNDNLACPLEYAFKRIYKPIEYSYGIQKVIKGDDFLVNTKEQLLEMRVSLQEQILELTDYPGYFTKIGLDEAYKQNLKDYNQLRLFIFTGQKLLQVNLTEAYNVEYFDD